MFNLLVACLIFINLSQAALDEEPKPFLDGRIIGGEEASILDFPYLVSIEYLSRHRCGGAIIARSWILTGAHCVEGLYYPYWIHVRAGTSYVQIGGQYLNVKAIIRHDNYSSETFDYDIALLQLEDPVQLSVAAQIVSLADNGDAVVEGDLARAAGWGPTEEGGTVSTVLRSVELPIINQTVCDKTYSYYGGLTDRMLCAGLLEGGIDTCAQDGGGPLMSGSRMIGITSWGVGCARSRYPGVYANVGVLRDWITQQTGI